MLPFNNNKWSLILEPSYNTYSNNTKLEGSYSPTVNEQYLDTKFNYFQLPFGVRYYIYLNDNTSIFLNGIYNAKISNDKNGVTYSYSIYKNVSFFETLHNFGFGVGFNYKKYSIETRLFSNTQLLINPSDRNKADYKNISINLRYQLF